SPGVANNFLSATPARKSLVGVQAATTSDQQAAVAAFIARSPETQAVVDDALAHALPASEGRFGDYVEEAASRINSENIDAHSALQEMESLAVANQGAAADKQSNLQVMVATPVPQTVLAPGKVTLKFGMLSFVSPLPNREQWDQVIQDFVADDPQV